MLYITTGRNRCCTLEVAHNIITVVVGDSSVLIMSLLITRHHVIPKYPRGCISVYDLSRKSPSFVQNPLIWSWSHEMHHVIIHVITPVIHECIGHHLNNLQTVPCRKMAIVTFVIIYKIKDTACKLYPYNYNCNSANHTCILAQSKTRMYVSTHWCVGTKVYTPVQSCMHLELIRITSLWPSIEALTNLRS